MKHLGYFLCLVLLLTGCTVNHPAEEPSIATQPATEFQEDEEPTVLSHEIAMLEGYVVVDEGDVRHNAGNWMKFLDACNAGEHAAVSVVSFTLGESGYTYIKYDLTFDGSMYAVEYVMDGELVRETATDLVYSTGVLESSEEPYDSYEQYALNNSNGI